MKPILIRALDKDILVLYVYIEAASWSYWTSIAALFVQLS